MKIIGSYLDELQQTLTHLHQKPIEETIDVLQEARMAGRQVFILGNGGSASTASHFVCDLAKNTRMHGWPHFRVIGLTDNMALITAYANDEGFENIFVQQLANFVQPADVVIAISTSGNSSNVLRAVKVANEMKATTIGFTGYEGGQLGTMVDINLNVPSDRIEQIEDIHLIFEHLICTALRELVQKQVPDNQLLDSQDGQKKNITQVKPVFLEESSN
ncbi:MAG: SIS domain-containing protein [Anaerolineae bacterium]|nr:MAG: SIS domain-containing protein [Anaerolineae bacterium]